MPQTPKYQQQQLEISTLGPCNRPSPLKRSSQEGDGVGNWIPEDGRMLYEPRFREGEDLQPLAFELAGAREQLYFDPSKTKAAIVTCGGLCPGINNVIRSLVLELRFNYGLS